MQQIPMGKSGRPDSHKYYDNGTKAQLSRPPSFVAHTRQTHGGHGGKNLSLLRPFIPTFLERGIIREIVTPQELFYSNLFTAPKKGGKVRPIINLKILNQYLNVPKFKMETVALVSKCIIQNLWGVIIDLKDAFFLIPIAWLFHKFLAFVIDNRIFVFQFMPFGLSLAPWAFTRIMRPIMREIHKKGIMSFCLLDDFLLTNLSVDTLKTGTAEILKILQGPGIQINWRKSSLIPRQRLDYLGIIFDFRKMTLSLPKDKVSNIIKEINSILAKAFCTRRELESLLGLLTLQRCTCH